MSPENDPARDAESPIRRSAGRRRRPDSQPRPDFLNPDNRSSRHSRARDAFSSVPDAPAAVHGAEAPVTRSAAVAAARAKRSHRRLTFGRAFTALASTAALSLTGAGWYALGDVNNKISTIPKISLQGEDDGAVDILLVGSDSRTDAHGNALSEKEIQLLRAGDEDALNTDTILLIRIEDGRKSAKAFSIPRDTYVSTGTEKMKINGVMREARKAEIAELSESGYSESVMEKAASNAGREALIKAVADLTGVRVDHYAEIGLLGFVLVTDAVGGVEVCLNQAVNEPLSGANFSAGTQIIGGADALSFVRQRHDLPAGDLDRIVRQQAFMASLVGRLLSSNTLSSPGTINQLISAAERSLVIDDEWDLVSFALKMRDVAGGNVEFKTIPVTNIDGVGDNGESVVLVDQQQVRSFIRSESNEDDEETSTPSSPAPTTNSLLSAAQAEKITVNVGNSTTIGGLATSVSEVLTRLGYQQGVISTVTDVVTNSYVGAYDPQSSEALAVSAQLGGLPVIADYSLDRTQISVVLAEDYQGPTSELSPTSSPTISEEVPEAIANRPTFSADPNGPRCVN